MRVFFYTLMLTFINLQAAKAGGPIKIVVIDTGYTAPKIDDGSPKPVFCKYGHADFTRGGTTFGRIPKDDMGHGTNVVHVIARYLGKVPKNSYCIVVVKYYHKNISQRDSMDADGRSWRWALSLKADVVNFSSAGKNYFDEEASAVRKLLDRGSKVVVSAGNDGMLGVGYPAASDPRLVVVGALKDDGKRLPRSNYGPEVTRWELGDNVCGGNICMSGTSQATAVATGKIVNKLIKERKSDDRPKNNSL